MLQRNWEIVPLLRGGAQSRGGTAGGVRTQSFVFVQRRHILKTSSGINQKISQNLRGKKQ